MGLSHSITTGTMTKLIEWDWISNMNKVLWHILRVMQFNPYNNLLQVETTILPIFPMEKLRYREILCLSIPVPPTLCWLNNRRDTHQETCMPVLLSFCFWPAVGPWACHSSINSPHTCWGPLWDSFRRWLPSVLSLSVRASQFCFSSLWILTSPVAALTNRMEKWSEGLLRPGPKRIGGFCFLPLGTIPLETQLPCCEQAQTATYRSPCGDSLSEANSQQPASTAS